jgi:hypothetical protein
MFCFVYKLLFDSGFFTSSSKQDTGIFLSQNTVLFVVPESTTNHFIMEAKKYTSKDITVRQCHLIHVVRCLEQFRPIVVWKLWENVVELP